MNFSQQAGWVTARLAPPRGSITGYGCILTDTLSAAKANYRVWFPLHQITPLYLGGKAARHLADGRIEHAQHAGEDAALRGKVRVRGHAFGGCLDGGVHGLERGVQEERRAYTPYNRA